MVRTLDSEFTLTDLERACPGVSRNMVRLVLRDIQAAGKVECLGRGPGARWRNAKKVIPLKRGKKEGNVNYGCPFTCSKMCRALPAGTPAALTSLYRATTSSHSARNRYSAGPYSVSTPSGRLIPGPPKGRYWVYSESKFKEMDSDSRIWWGKDGNNDDLAVFARVMY